MTSRVWIIIAALAAAGTGTTLAVRSAQSPSSTGPSAAPAAAQAAPGLPAVVDVRLDLLEQPHDVLSPPGRDPFQFRAAPAPAAAPRPVLAAAVPPAPVVPPGPPPLPPIPLRYIGLIESAQATGRVALLSDGRGGVMHGREGDMIEGRYRVLRVGLDSIELAYADGRGRQTIRLSGQ